MDRWQLIRTAHSLAKNGTISGAATELGVHRATVLRHIDSLEEQLGVNLFQRHARGYLPTEAGEDLMRVVGAADEQFGQLLGRLKQNNQPLSGEFTLTSLAPMASYLIPIIKAFQTQHPGIQVRYLTSTKLFRLEYGEAHVAVRAGPKPDLPDNVVIPFTTQQVSLFAHRDYLTQYGHPAGSHEIAGHRFVSFQDLSPSVPVHEWIAENVNPDDIAIKSNDGQVIKQAILEGLGVGFLLRQDAAPHPQLIELFPALDAWTVPQWLVIHRDLYRSSKVQAFLEVARGMGSD